MPFRAKQVSLTLINSNFYFIYYSINKLLYTFFFKLYYLIINNVLVPLIYIIPKLHFLTNKGLQHSIVTSIVPKYIIFISLGFMFIIFFLY